MSRSNLLWYSSNSEVIVLLDALKGFHEFDRDGPEMCAICANDSAYFVFISPEDNEGKYHCVECGCEYIYKQTLAQRTKTL